MTAKAVLAEMKPLGRDSYKRVLFNNYGVKEPCFGVAIGELKKFQKRIKKDYQLALDLYDSGNYDAMYLAGLIADDARMTKTDLQRWAEKAYAGSLPGTTVPSVAAGSPHGWTVALKWLESPKALIASAGWATLSCLVALKPDSELDLPELKRLLLRVQKTIHSAPDVVRYQMNAFVISVGGYVQPLTGLPAAYTSAIATNGWRSRISRLWNWSCRTAARRALTSRSFRRSSGSISLPARKPPSHPNAGSKPRW